MTALAPTYTEPLIDTIPSEMTLKRRRRTRQASFDSTSSVSSGDSVNKPVRKQQQRNNNKRKNTNTRKKNKPQPQQPELSQDEKNQYIAIDCEMVGTGVGGQRSSLARVCMVDWDGNTVLDLYVRQEAEVTDYRTFVSGITADDLVSDDAVDFDECRRQVLDVLEDKILVGHALKNDLHALRISHAWQQIRDTGKYEPFMKVRFADGILWPRKLKDLAKEKLGKDIQQPGRPHCPFEDAQTAFDLYKKTRNKWEKAMDYKIKKTMEIQRATQ